MFSFLFGRSKPAKARRRQTPLKLESLEDRTVPAVFTVTTIADEGDGSLRDAVAKANALAGADQINIVIPGSSQTGAKLNVTTGELAVTDDLTIVGEGMSSTAVQANRQSRIFNVEGTAKVTLNLQKMTLYQGLAQGEGGAVRVAGGVLNTTEVDFYGNAADKGGAVSIADRNGIAGEASFTATIFDHNIAGTSGGALYVNSSLTPAQGASAAVSGGNFAFNTSNGAGGGGGAIAVESGVLDVQNSSFVNNTSQGSGGGIQGEQNSTLNIIGSTFSQNGSTNGLGGAAILAKGGLLLSNSTVVQNTDTSGSSIGGVRAMGSSGMLLSSTIIANNTGLSVNGSPDLQTAVPVVSDGHNLVEKADGVAGLLGTDLISVDPKLGPLQYNGGTTASLVPLAGSPVVGKGNNPYGSTTDQRGTGFNRVTQGAVDIGAVQFDAANVAPAAALTYAPTVGVDGSMTSYAFVVQYTDDTAVNLGSLGNVDVIVTGPNGFSQAATLAETDRNVNAATLQAQYTITPPGGKWTPLANGTYTVTLQGEQVFDEKGRPVQGQVLGTFVVNVQGDQVGYVEALYRSVLGRASDADSLKAYTDRINNGESRATIADEVWNSIEHRTHQVNSYYQSLLGRNPDAEGLEYWTNRLMSGASEEEVTAGILGSKEFQESKPSTATLTNNFYYAVLGRPADASAQDYAAKIDNGAATPQQVAKELATSQERVDLHVQTLYQQVLLRQADEEGGREWAKKAKDAGVAEVAVDMLASDEFFKLHGSTV
jgi:predicted outer membrane repeat protein